MKRILTALIVACVVVLSMAFLLNGVAAEPSVAAATADQATKDQATVDSKPVDNTPIDEGTPWIRLISFGIILLIIIAIIILSRTNTKIGLRLKKFFKEYGSEIKKVSWLSKKDTLKATGVVLAFLIVAAVAIGLLDFGFTKLIQLLANIF